jgi:hypothetical protein
MSKFHTGALTAAAGLAALLSGLALDLASAAPAGTDTQEQAAPQGKDPPGADDNGSRLWHSRTE